MLLLQPWWWCLGVWLFHFFIPIYLWFYAISIFLPCIFPVNRMDVSRYYTTNTTLAKTVDKSFRRVFYFVFGLVRFGSDLPGFVFLCNILLAIPVVQYLLLFRYTGHNNTLTLRKLKYTNTFSMLTQYPYNTSSQWEAHLNYWRSDKDGKVIFIFLLAVWVLFTLPLLLIVVDDDDVDVDRRKKLFQPIQIGCHTISDNNDYPNIWTTQFSICFLSSFSSDLPSTPFPSHFTSLLFLFYSEFGYIDLIVQQWYFDGCRTKQDGQQLVLFAVPLEYKPLCFRLTTTYRNIVRIPFGRAVLACCYAFHRVPWKLTWKSTKFSLASQLAMFCALCRMTKPM